MQKRGSWRYDAKALLLVPFFVFAAALALFVAPAMAQTSTSPNYQMTESQFGNTTMNQSCSAGYCATVSIGDEGRSSSATSPEFGEIDYSEPMLEMIVTPGASFLGNLSTTQAGTKTMGVKIRNYLTGGYRLQIIGETPKYGDRTLARLETPTASEPGREQFGINAVANTTPSVGANPVLQNQVASPTETLMANYNTPNLYMYQSGQVIAETTENTGGADYTITMLVNISNTTPAGHYSSDFAAVVTPYF